MHKSCLRTTLVVLRFRTAEADSCTCVRKKRTRKKPLLIYVKSDCICDTPIDFVTNAIPFDSKSIGKW